MLAYLIKVFLCQNKAHFISIFAGNMAKLYHYTTEENGRRIMDSRIIWATEDGGRDAVLGRGVYLNDFSPKDKSKEEIAVNNWGIGSTKKLQEGYVDVAIEININDIDIDRIKRDKYRNVFVYPGHLKLPRSARLVHVTPEKNTSTAETGRSEERLSGLFVSADK